MNWIETKAKANRVLYLSDEEMYEGIEDLLRTSFLGYFYLAYDDRYLRSSIRNDKEKKLYHLFWGNSDDGYILNNKPSVYMTIDTDKMIYTCVTKHLSLFDMVVRIYFKLNIELYASKLYKQYAVR